jgi:hypothetical protein
VSEMAFTSANYLRASEWMTCLHCHLMVRGKNNHYCGAPWQSEPVEEGFDHSGRARQVRELLRLRGSEADAPSSHTPEVSP